MKISTRVPPSVAMLVEDESGGTLMEYALIGALALAVCALVVLAFRKLSMPSA